MGSKTGEPFDLEDIMNNADKLQTLQMARQSLGDEAVKSMLGQDPVLLEENLRKLKKEGMAHLLAMTRS